MLSRLKDPKYNTQFLLVSFYIVISLTAFLFSFISYRAIDQRIPKDYSYYMQFFSKVYDNSFSEKFSPTTGICMHGHNIFFMDGCDGVKNINRSLHFEPSKYAIAGLFLVFNSPVILLIFYILIFYLPLLYVVFIIRKNETINDFGLLALSVVAYSLYPASFTLVSDAFRPMVFFFPIFTLFVLSIIYKRSLLEKIIFLNLLVFVREEGFILALIGIFYLFLLELYERKNHIDSKKLFINALLWLIPITIYMKWIANDYSYIFNLGETSAKIISIIQSNIFVFSIATILLIALIAYFFVKGFYKQILSWIDNSVFGRGFIVFSIPISIIIFLLVMGWTAFPWTAQFIYWRMGMLTVMFSIIGLLAIMENLKSTDRERNFWKVVLILSIIFSISSQFLSISSPFNNYLSNKNKISDAQLVFASKEILTEKDLVIADPKTMMVLYPTKHSVVYNGIPSSLDISLIKNLFKNPYGGKTYVLISKESIDSIMNLGVKLVSIDKNNSYGFYLVK